jgi:hypothetical protein
MVGREAGEATKGLQFALGLKGRAGLTSKIE